MKEFFKKHRFNDDAWTLLRACREVVGVFHGRGLKMTLRQLFYQLVSRNAIRNEDKQYKRLSALLSDARLMGLIDWEAIEDRLRIPRKHPEFADLDELVDAALSSYRLPRWEGQKNYVELWVEKEALAGILTPITREYHVNLMVNRGYSSQTAMYDSAKRFLTACYGKAIDYDTLERIFAEDGKACPDAFKDTRVLAREKLGEPERSAVLFYLGDHDPSGVHMSKDVGDRLTMFGIDVDVRKLALTKEQIEEHGLPPNPTKMQDPRAAEYVDEHGDTCWELDALPPDVLDQVVRGALEDVLDRELMDAVIRREERDKKRLRKALESLDGRRKK